MISWILRLLGYRADYGAVKNGRVGKRIMRRAGFRIINRWL
jgi:hypothetical protein